MGHMGVSTLHDDSFEAGDLLHALRRVGGIDRRLLKIKFSYSLLVMLLPRQGGAFFFALDGEGRRICRWQTEVHPEMAFGDAQVAGGSRPRETFVTEFASENMSLPQTLGGEDMAGGTPW